MSNTSTQKPGLEKPTIAAKAFGDLRLKFIANRFNQYAERKGITAKAVQDFINDSPNRNNVTKEIDSVVEESLHSSKCPDPSKYNIF